MCKCECNNQEELNMEVCACDCDCAIDINDIEPPVQEDYEALEKEREAKFNERIEFELAKYHEVNNIDIPSEAVYEIFDIMSSQGHSGFSAGYVIAYLEEYAKNPEKTLQSLNNVLEASKEDKDECAHDMQKLITDNIMELINAFKRHNLESEITTICLLLDGKPITPLTGEDDEWEEEPLYEHQVNLERRYCNKRCSSVVKNVYKNGLVLCYDVDSHTYSDNGGICYFTTGRFGRTEITFPYVPSKEAVQLFEPEDETYFILTNPETIKKLHDIKKEEYDSEYL